MEAFDAPFTTPAATLPTELLSHLEAIPPIPPQGFAPHVELDGTGRLVFAPPAALDTEGNNLPRLRNLLPQLLETADELRDLLSRGNQAHAALIHRLAAYRACLHPDLRQVALSRVLAEGIRLENAATAQARIDATDLPPHDELAQEALNSLLQFHRMFVMATADGPAMLADEARYTRPPADEAAYQASLRSFAATVAQSPDAIAPEIAETLSDSLAQQGETSEAARARRLGDSLAGNIAITVVAGATVGTIVAGLVSLGPAGIAAGAALGLLAGKGLEKSKPFAETVAAVSRLYDHATDIEPAMAATRLTEGLARARAFADRARPALSALGEQGGRFTWLRRALPWLDRAPSGDASGTPPDFSLEEVKRIIFSGKSVPALWVPLISDLDLSLTWRGRDGRRLEPEDELAPGTSWGDTADLLRGVEPINNLTALRTLNLARTGVTDLTPLASLTALQTLNLTGTQVTDLAPLARLTALQSLTLWNTKVTDLTPLATLTALQSLNLENTQVSDLAPLARLTALQSLHLGGTQIADLARLTSLTALQSLNLRDTQVSELAPLSSLAALRFLNLRDTQVADLAPLASLTALQTINLAHTKVTDLAPLTAHPNLRHLNLTGLPEGIESALSRYAEIEFIRRRQF